MSSKVLVIGGAGFLGKFLVSELALRGFEVTVADITENQLSEKSKFFKCNILDKNNLDTLFDNDQYDYVYNLAGFANLDKAVNFPVETFNLNVIGNLNILENCRKHNIKMFIYASSAYAMNNKGSFYGISKLASEKIVEEYHKRFGLNYIILRYGSVYSELPFENNYIYQLVHSALKNKKIEHSGDGNEIREYIHASDAAKLSVDVLLDENYLNKHIILTGNEKMKRLELFRLIEEIANEPIDIILNQSGKNHHYTYTPYSFEPSVSYKLTPNPYIDMGQGILECIKSFYKENN
jgi:UDP-glucose 4-epimerase